ATDAATQLVELSQPETFSMLDNHDRGIGHIDADLDDGCRDEYLELALVEHAHHLIFHIGVETAVEQSNLHIRKNSIAKFFVHLKSGFQLGFLPLLNDGVNDIGLVAGSDVLA